MLYYELEHFACLSNAEMIDTVALDRLMDGLTDGVDLFPVALAGCSPTFPGD